MQGCVWPLMFVREAKAGGNPRFGLPDWRLIARQPGRTRFTSSTPCDLPIKTSYMPLMATPQSSKVANCRRGNASTRGAPLHSEAHCVTEHA